MNEDAKKDFIRNLPGYSVLPPGAREVFADILVYDSEMANESAKALNLVTEAMETGQFNHEAYNKIQNRLKELPKGHGVKKAYQILPKTCVNRYRY